MSPSVVRDVAVGGQAEQGLEVVVGPVSLRVDVVRGLHRPHRPRAVRRDAVRGLFDARLRGAAPTGGEILLHERLVTGLEQVHGPGNGVRPQAVHVLARCSHHIAGLGEQRVRVAVRALREQVGQNAHHVVAELALVAVDAGVEVVAAACDLRRDEAALVGVDERALGHVDLGDAGQLRIPEGAHVCEVRGESARRQEGLVARPRSSAAETVGNDDVVVIDGVMGEDGVGCAVERHEGSGGTRGQP